MSQTFETVAMPGAEAPAAAELPIWMDAISAHIQEQIKAKGSGQPDSLMLAVAIKDTQRALMGGKDPYDLYGDLPAMAARANAHPYRDEFKASIEPGGPQITLSGIQTMGASLIKAANRQLAKQGHPRHDYGFLEVISRRNNPPLHHRLAFRLGMPDTRNLLLKTVLG